MPIVEGGFAVKAGQFFGAVLGETIKVAGPALRPFLVGIISDGIKAAFQDKAVDSKPGTVDAAAAADVLRHKDGAGATGATNPNPERYQSKGMGFGRERDAGSIGS